MRFRNSPLRTKNIERTVHYIPVRNAFEQNRKMMSLATVLNHRAFRLFDMFSPSAIVGIKPCMNDAHIAAEYIVSMSELLRQRVATPCICDTSDRYKDRDANGVKHCASALVEESGYGEMALPYIMLDGILSDHEISANTHGVIPPGVCLAGDLPGLGGLISFCAPRLSTLAGVSGSIVNTGMGLASRRGKILQHTMSPPKVNVEKCRTCRKCVRACPVKAIAIDGDHVVIDPARCINCGLCTEVAKFGGIAYDWNATPEHFQRAVTLHALGVRRVLKGRIIYINLLSMGIDCGAMNGGILVSLNPVAIDAATLDICRQFGGIDEDGYTRASRLVAFGERLGLGVGRYRLNTIAY